MIVLPVQFNAAGGLCVSRSPRNGSPFYYSQMEKLFLAFGQTIGLIHTGWIFSLDNP
jgi:hypothetical protein